MKKVFFVLVLLLCSVQFTSGQNTKGDSLFTGRVCKLVLYNGFQTEGKITDRINDTLSFQTDIINLFIPVKDIKFVLNPEIELSDVEEFDTLKYNEVYVHVVKIDTTEECDIYMDNKSVLKDVKLIIDSDSTLKTVKENKTKIIGIAGIRKIVFKPSAPFWKGYLYGSLTGFVIGFTPVAFSKGGGHPDFSGVGVGVIFGLVLSIPSGLIGGVIGVLAATDDVYLFDNGIYPAKIKRIKYAMGKHY